ncbi:MAG: hypothetical protein H6598_04605 [Flavobacteriales bacterium]|nr:hypothetical protein [Flavobacteriales bacterium]
MKKKLLIMGLGLMALSAFGQIGGKLAKKVIDNKFNNVDETLVQDMEFYLDGNLSKTVSSIPDGTKSLAIKCPINKEASSLKTMGMSSQFTWEFVMTIIEHSADNELVETVMYSKNDNIEDWNSIISGDGYLLFELEESDLLRPMKYSDGNLEAQSLTIKCELHTVCSKGKSYLNRGTITMKSEGVNGKWANGSVEEAISAYKPGGSRYQGSTKSDVFLRMLEHTKGTYPTVDLIHLKVLSTSPTDDGRLVSDIIVTLSDKGKCYEYHVSVWEDKYTLSLSNYVPQVVSDLSDAFCSRKEEIRNIK